MRAEYKKTGDRCQLVSGTGQTLHRDGWLVTQVAVLPCWRRFDGPHPALWRCNGRSRTELDRFRPQTHGIPGKKLHWNWSFAKYPLCDLHVPGGLGIAISAWGMQNAWKRRGQSGVSRKSFLRD